MTKRKSEKIFKEKQAEIQEFREILNGRNKTSQEILYECKPLKIKFRDVEPIAYASKNKGKIEIKEINGASKSKKTAPQLIRIIKKKS